MNILIKFIVKNIIEKKLRTVLIVFSVALSTALFFATSSISDSFQKMYEESVRSQIGSADIYLKGNTENPLIDISKLEIDDSKYSSKLEVFEFRGVYGKNEDSINIRGLDISELEKINRIDYKEKSFEGDLGEREIIISEKTAREEDRGLNDEFEIDLNGTFEKFKIVGISTSAGFFSDELDYRKSLVSMNSVELILGVKDRANLIYIDSKENVNNIEFLKEIEGQNENIAASETISQEEIETLRSTISTPFYMILSVIMIMSVFIIYSAFKVIVLERMANIGTFRSVGATKLSTTAILVFESFIYGVLGSGIGIGIGVLILKLMVAVLGGVENTGTETEIVFSYMQVVSSFMLGIVISALSSLLPILKINKYPIKEIVLDFHKDKESDGNKKFFIGIGMMVASISIQLILRETENLVLALGVIILFIVGSILITPYIVKLFTRVSKKLWSRIFGNESFIALKNINTKVLSNNIALFIIGISVVLAITSVTKSVERFIVGVYDEMDYSVRVKNVNDYDEFLEKIKDIDSVEKSYNVLETGNVNIKDSDERITLLQGIDRETHFDFYRDIDIFGDEEGKLNELKLKNTIIIHKTIAKKLGLEEGDTIEVESGNSYQKLRIVGIMDTSVGGNGRYAIVDDENMKELFPEYTQTILLRGADIEQNVRTKLKGENYIVTSIEDEKEELVDSNRNFMLMLQGFIYMAVAVGVFGVINNLVISFLQRKHDIAVYRSIGMDNGQVKKMFIMEGFFSGLLGSGLGVLLGIAILRMIPYIINAMDVPMKIEYPLDLILGHFIVGFLVIFISSSSLMLRTSGISIIQEIRYE